MHTIKANELKPNMLFTEHGYAYRVVSVTLTFGKVDVVAEWSNKPMKFSWAAGHELKAKRG